MKEKNYTKAIKNIQPPAKFEKRILCSIHQKEKSVAPFCNGYG